MITRIADTLKLPTELMADAKAFMRVDHCDDDKTILMMIGAAIDQLELQGTIIHPSQITWTVDEYSTAEVEIAPEQRITPISQWSAIADAGDVTAQYSLKSVGLAGSRYYSLAGDFQTGLALAITAGFAQASLVPFGIQASIFKATSTLYEYREILTPANLSELPDWLNAKIGLLWVPMA